MVSPNAHVKMGPDAAFDMLCAALGEPMAMPGGFRWVVSRCGHDVRVELATSGEDARSDVVWIFDPSARGLSTFLSFDVNTSDGISWLDLELRRLTRR